MSSRSLNHYRQICDLRYCNRSWLKPTQLSLSSTTNIKEQSTEILWQRPALNNSHYLTDTFRSWHLSNQKKKSTTAHFDTKQSKHKTDSLCLYNYTSCAKESNWCHKQLSCLIFTDCSKLVHLMMRKLLAFLEANPYLGLPPNWELMKQSVTPWITSIIIIIIITRPNPPYGPYGPSRIVGKDTVRRVHFGAFSTSHFAPSALSSDWIVLI